MNKTPIQHLVDLVKIWDADTDAPGYGSPAHCHNIRGLWDGDNIHPKGSVCEECATHDAIRRIVSEHLAGNPEWEPASHYEASHEGQEAFKEWFAQRGTVPRLTYLEVFEAGQTSRPAVVALSPLTYIKVLREALPGERPVPSRDQIPDSNGITGDVEYGAAHGWNNYRAVVLKVLETSTASNVDYRLCDGDLDD